MFLKLQQRVRPTVGLAFMGLALLQGCAVPSAESTASAGRIEKVLMHYLDEEGRHAVAPSLFDRDAYQAYLREHPEERGGMQFDVQWSAANVPDTGLILRLELRTAGGNPFRPFRVQSSVTRQGWGDTWTQLKVDKSSMEPLGDVIAWRATLWDGGRLLHMRRSFLWKEQPAEETVSGNL